MPRPYVGYQIKTYKLPPMPEENSTQQQPQPEAEQPQESQTTQPQQPKIEKAKEIKKKKATKKTAVGCIGAGCGALVLIFFGFLIFISQAGEGINPILQMFGIEEAQLINTLIDLTNVGFGLFTFIAFIVAIIGLFKIGTVRKEDKAAKKKGIILTFIGMAGFLLSVFLWITAYFYLDSQKVTMPQPTQLIITDPADLTSLTAPETISFDASGVPYNGSKFQVLSYKWEFGDGYSATGQKISHTYKTKGPKDGRFEVILTMTLENISTEEEIEKRHSLNVTFVNERVQATFEAEPETGEAPLKVKFDASGSMDPDGEIISYEWEFNEDGRFDDAKGVEAEYTYEKTGKYKAELRVTDNSDEFDVAEKIIEVTEKAALKAVITHDNTVEKFYAGESYTFSGENSTSPNGKIKKYEWDFGDKSPKVETITASHIFQEAGNYTVTLKITDEKNIEAEGTLDIIAGISDGAPEAVITTVPALEEDEEELKGSAPFQVEFNASNSKDKDDNIIEYQWDFDGDSKIDSKNVKATYTYPEKGSYEAKLTVIDADDNEGEATLKIQVGEQQLKADIKADPISGEVPLVVNFDASSSTYPGGEIVSFEWDFGDSTPVRIGDAKISHRYTAIGTFTARVTAIASDGKKAKKTLDINIRPVTLASCYEVNVKEGPAPLIVTFDPRCSTGTITEYKWDFGDGQTSRDRKPTHTFEDAGVYDVTLEVSDNQDVVDSFTDQIVVKGEVE